MNTEKIIDNLNLQGAQIKALQIHQERLAQRLDIYAKSMDASVPRTIRPDVGNYTSPLFEAMKAMHEVISKANALSQPIPRYKQGTSRSAFISESMPVTPGWNGRQVADWTRSVAEEPKDKGWYETFGDKGTLKKWWGGDIWYDSDSHEIEDPFYGRVYFWRPIPSSLKMKVSISDTSPEFHAFLKETKTTFFPAGTNTELHVNGVELFFLASAWGQQQYIKAHPSPIRADSYGTEITSSVVKGFELNDDKIFVINNDGLNPLKARYSETYQPGITYYPYESFIGVKKDGKSFFTLQTGKWFKDSERPVPFQLRTIQGEKVLCEDFPSGLGWACKTEDMVNAALAGRLRLINPPQQERKYRYFVTMPWGEKVPDYDGKMPPFTGPTVKLKPGQVWEGSNFSYEIRGFSSKTVIFKVMGNSSPSNLVEVGLAEFREAIQKGFYKLRP